MRSLERVKCAINHQQPDRIPIDLRFAPEMLDKLLLELQMDERQFWDWAGQDIYTIRPKYPNPATTIKYADPTIEIDEKGYYLDIYRVPFMSITNNLQTYLEPVDSPPLKDFNTIEALDRFPWPKVDAWDYSQIEMEIDQKSDKALWSRTRGVFQTAQLMRGMEKFLVDLALEPEFACRIMDHILDFIYEDARCTIEAGKGKYTYVEYNDDVATQRGLLISPAMWRKYVKPRMKQFFDMVHNHGLPVKYHSCGSIYALIPDLIEIGVNILNPIQIMAINMNPFKIKKEFGKDLCLHGAIDIQYLLPEGSAKEVREYVHKLIDIVGKDGGYILAGTHTIQTDAKIENILALVEEARGL
jgi:uroporphyrinogen decarboxylase